MSKLKNCATGAALALTALALGGCYYAPAPGYAYAAPAYGYAPGYYAAPAYGYAPYGGVELSLGGRGRGRW